MFVTSQTYGGNLGGPAGANTKCQVLARAAKLEGTYRAWISTENSSPNSTFAKANTGYLRVDGVMVANNWADLTDGSIDNPIGKTELNQNPGSTDVWTDTNTAGNHIADAEDCQNWSTNILGIGREGRTNATNGDWTNSGFLDDSICSTSQRLYCFEQ